MSLYGVNEFRNEKQNYQRRKENNEWKGKKDSEENESVLRKTSQIFPCVFNTK